MAAGGARSCWPVPRARHLALLSAMDVSTSYRRLQWRALRATAWALAVSTAARQLLSSPMHAAPLEIGRVMMLLYCMAVERWATAETAARHGIALTTVVALLTTAKVLEAPDGHVVDFTAVYGAHRVVPLLAAVFGGTPFCLATSVWAGAETAIVLYLRRAAARGLSLAELFQGGHVLARHDLEVSMLWSELQYITLIAVLSCVLLGLHRQALEQLADALQSRQRFVEHMVPCWRVAGGVGCGFAVAGTG